MSKQFELKLLDFESSIEFQGVNQALIIHVLLTRAKLMGLCCLIVVYM
jgi:hypothetical protein